MQPEALDDVRRAFASIAAAHAHNVELLARNARASLDAETEGSRLASFQEHLAAFLTRAEDCAWEEYRQVSNAAAEPEAASSSLRSFRSNIFGFDSGGGSVPVLFVGLGLRAPAPCFPVILSSCVLLCVSYPRALLGRFAHDQALDRGLEQARAWLSQPGRWPILTCQYCGETGLHLQLHCPGCQAAAAPTRLWILSCGLRFVFFGLLVFRSRIVAKFQPVSACPCVNKSFMSVECFPEIPWPVESGRR